MNEERVLNSYCIMFDLTSILFFFKDGKIEYPKDFPSLAKDLT